MIDLQDRVNAFARLGLQLQELSAQSNKGDTGLNSIFNKAFSINKWFSIKNQLNALEALSFMLQEADLKKWAAKYTKPVNENRKLKKVGIICAGNIPAVGFHDFMCVLVSGHIAQLKFSSDDSTFFPYLLDLLLQIEPGFAQQVQIVEKINMPDAVIATGSGNSARYFEYYFGKYPHIIRRNRNSVAVLTGNETEKDFRKLATDIFSYFGLGCRNVSKLYVPEGYSFDLFFESVEDSGPELMAHNKYMNNYDYHKALFLLEAIPFLTNNFLILKQDKQIPTPVSVLHYEHYKDEDSLKQALTFNLDHIQCIVSHLKLIGDEIDFGDSQKPSVGDYADDVDTMQFLLSL